MIKIVVSSNEKKHELIAASRHIHDLEDIDTDIPMVNFMAHLYMAPELIEVEDEC